MRLAVECGVFSSRLDRLLARGCLHSGGERGRLTSLQGGRESRNPMFVMLFGNQAADDVTTTPPHIYLLATVQIGG
jgi:hypothetical protein